MFYVYLISKILLFYLLPYFAITRKASKTLINIKSILLFSWLVYLAFLTYIPFIDYYFENEVNIQYLVPDYALLLIIIIFLIILIFFVMFACGYTRTHYSKSQIFVQKFNFDKTPTFSRVFHPNFF